MRRPLVAASLLILVLPLCLGCNKLQGRRHFHKANALYENEQYREALKEFQDGLQQDPSADFVWRSVGLSALALYRPGDENAQNKQMADTAIDAFRKYLEGYPNDAKVREYLVSTLMGAKRHDEAIEVLEEDARNHPGEKQYSLAVIRALTDAGKLEQAMQRAEQLGANDPELFYTIGVNAWAKSYYQPPANVDDHRKLIELGMNALERSDKIHPDNFDTLSYLNLMWRELVKVEIDPFKQQEYLAKAQGYFDRAMAARKEQEQKLKTAAEQST
jgi:tetratricopeptide (TPR) repeat protein